MRQTKMPAEIEVYAVTTDRDRKFWVVATSPDRAIRKLRRKGRRMLDKGETINGSSCIGTLDVI